MNANLPRVVAGSVLIRLASLPLTAGAAFISTYLVVQAAGTSGFGAITIVTTLTLLLPYTDLGLGAAVINAVAEDGNEVGRDEVLNTTVFLTTASGLVVCLVGIAGTSLFSWSELFGVSETSLTGFSVYTSVYCLLIGTSVPLGLGQRVLVGAQRNVLATTLLLITPVSTVIGSVIVATWKLPPAAFIVVPGAATFVTALITFILAKRVIRWQPRLFEERSWQTVKSVLQLGVWYLLMTVASATILQAGRLILAARASLDAAAQFSIVMQLYGPVWSLFLVAATALWPAFVRSRSGSPREVALLLRNSSVAALCFALVVLVGFLTVGPFAVGVLSGGLITASVGLMGSCAFLVAAQSMQVIYGSYLTTAADFRFQAINGIVAAASSVVICVFLAPILGTASAFIASGLSILIFGAIPNARRVQKLIVRHD